MLTFKQLLEALKKTRLAKQKYRDPGLRTKPVYSLRDVTPQSQPNSSGTYIGDHIDEEKRPKKGKKDRNMPVNGTSISMIAPQKPMSPNDISGYDLGDNVNQ